MVWKMSKNKILDKLDEEDLFILQQTAKELDWNVEDLIAYLTTKSIRAIDEIRQQERCH